MAPYIGACSTQRESCSGCEDGVVRKELKDKGQWCCWSTFIIFAINVIGK